MSRPSSSSAPQSDRARRMGLGYGWLATTRWFDRLLAIAATIFLARLLTPEDHGLVAVAASVVAILEGLSEFDVQRAVIHEGDDDEDLFDTAWTLAALRGVLVALLLVVLSLAVHAVGDPRIAVLLATLALAPLLAGFVSPQFVRYERELRYGPLGLSVVVSKLFAFTLSVWVAWQWRTHWALVVQILAGTFATTALSYVFSPARPRWCLARAREILRFSGWMTLANGVTTLAMSTDRILINWFLGTRAAGLYHVTQRIGVLPTAELVSPLQRVLFPSLRQIRDNRDRLRSAVLESIAVLAGMSLPASVGFALVADRFVPLVLEDQWLDIVPLLWWLVPFLGFRATLSVTQPTVLALGRTELLFRVSWIYALVHVPVFVGLTWRSGLAGAIAAIVLAGVAYWLLNAWLLRTTLGVTLREILGAVTRPLLGLVAMSAVLLPLRTRELVTAFSLAGSQESWLVPALDLGLRVALGALAYGAAVYLVWRLQGRPGGLERRLIQALRSQGMNTAD